jgi:hypothetical protein
MGTVDRQGPLISLLNWHINHQPGAVRKGVVLPLLGSRHAKGLRTKWL